MADSEAKTTAKAFIGLLVDNKESDTLLLNEIDSMSEDAAEALAQDLLKLNEHTAALHEKYAALLREKQRIFEQ